MEMRRQEKRNSFSHDEVAVALSLLLPLQLVDLPDSSPYSILVRFNILHHRIIGSSLLLSSG
jgi:hypothetical protein